MRYGQLPELEILRDKFRDFEVPPSSGDPRYHLDELRNSYIQQSLRQVLSGTAGKLSSGAAGAEVLKLLQQQLHELTRDTSLVRDVDITDVEAARRDLEARKRHIEAMGGVMGIPTGFDAFDAAYPTGLAPGHMVVVIGWSARGKTLFASLLAVRAWQAGFKPMFVSLEMSPEAVRDRIYTIIGDGTFKNSDLVRANIDIDEFERWGTRNLSGKNDFVIVSSEGSEEVTPLTIQSKIDQHRPDIVVVDYHQLLSDNEQSQNEVSRNRNASRQLKNLAVRNNLVVVDLSQATQRDVSDTDEPPLIEQVANSRGIQHDADLAIAVHKYPDTNIFSIIARKSRHGELFAFTLDWDVNTGKIIEVYD